MELNANKRAKAPKTPSLRAGDVIGSGDSYLVTDLLPPEIADVAFENMKKEVKWETMVHRGELCLFLFLLRVQHISQEARFRDWWQWKVKLARMEGTDDQGCHICITNHVHCCSFPVYRFPSDGYPLMSPFSPTVALIREHVQKVSAIVLQFFYL